MHRAPICAGCQVPISEYMEKDNFYLVEGKWLCYWCFTISFPMQFYSRHCHPLDAMLWKRKKKIKTKCYYIGTIEMSFLEVILCLMLHFGKWHFNVTMTTTTTRKTKIQYKSHIDGIWCGVWDKDSLIFPHNFNTQSIYQLSVPFTRGLQFQLTLDTIAYLYTLILTETT